MENLRIIKFVLFGKNYFNKYFSKFFYFIIFSMSDFEDGDKVRIITCLHRFHIDCIKPWLEKNSTCPGKFTIII